MAYSPIQQKQPEDQTNPDWLPQNRDVNEPGTGILARRVRRPSDQDRIKVDYFPGITYDECRKQADGNSYDIFRWVPERISDYDKLLTVYCGGGSCESRGYCEQPGCICLNGVCTKGDN